MRVLLGEEIGVVVQTEQVVGIEFNGSIVGGIGFFIEFLAAEDVSQQRVEVGCRFGVSSVINSEHAALQDFDGFVVFAESVEDGGFIVVKNHLRGFIEQTVTAELKRLLEVLI